MNKFSAYVTAMRLRTLPMSLAGVALGLMLAASDYRVNVWVVFFTVLVTLSLQILSNVANELGDFLRGTDRAEDRQGPSYALSQGLLTEKDLKRMIYVFVLLCIAFGVAMIWFSFGTLFSLGAVIVALMGVAAISGAIKYTLGRNPYGYRGKGDMSVFIFFGLVSVLGSYFVATHEIRTWILVLPAVSIGCFSVGVLNVNNIRDIKSDALTRRTIPVRIGEKNAKIYHTALITAGWAAMILYSSMRMFDWWHYLFVLTLPLFLIHLVKVWKNTGKALDRQLPFLVISSFLFALLSGFGYIVYLL